MAREILMNSRSWFLLSRTWVIQSFIFLRKLTQELSRKKPNSLIWIEKLEIYQLSETKEKEIDN
jgi:hypothetical protein